MVRFSLCCDDNNNNEDDPIPETDQPLIKKPRLNHRCSAGASTSKSAMALLDDLLGTNGEQTQIGSEDTSLSEEENVKRGGKLQNFSSSSEEEEQVEMEEEEEVPPAGNLALIGTGVTLTDTDLLDCPICLEPLSFPVYQCENGHLACDSCCNKTRNKCSCCCLPIGYNRCRGIEKILESAKVSCQNREHGCTEAITYNKKLDHENTCTFVPCSCPISNCSYVNISKSLFNHFKLHHNDSAKKFNFNRPVFINLREGQKHVFLQEKNEQTIFILNRSFEPLGEILNVVCISPIASNKDFSYDLTAKADESTFTLQSLVDCMPKWDAGEPLVKKYIVIPSDLRRSAKFFSLQLVIRKCHG